MDVTPPAKDRMSFRWSPWSGEERREPEGQVEERVFLSSLSFARSKERDSQPMFINRKVHRGLRAEKLVTDTGKIPGSWPSPG